MTTTPSRPPLISARGISRSFGQVRALRDITLDIAGGEVHGLVGANGAGKSTFLNVLGGSVAPDAGILEIDGQPTTISGPRASARLGFAFMHQELALVPDFSAIDNMTIGVPATTPLGVGDGPRRRKLARDVAERLDMRFRLDRPVKGLSVAERGLVAIGRALVGEARFVSMDEPTASLSDVETERLFAIVRELSASGVSIAYVSHRLDEIEELCDTVTVFKDGAVAGRFERGAYDRDDLVLGITGARSLGDVQRVLPAVAESDSVETRVALEVRNLQRLPQVKDVSFTVREGEILGLAGVVGAGRTETLRLLFAAERRTGGEVALHGRPYNPRSVPDAIAAGVALVPEERRSQALAMDDSITLNVAMGGWRANRSWRGLPFISDGRARARAAEMMERLRIKAHSPSSAVKTLSGGNQQKVVFARWLTRDAKVMLLDEPTRGVDVGARRQIWETAEDFARSGGAVVVVCSELAELAVCHRVVVMVEGRDVGVLHGPGVTEEQMLEAIYRHTPQKGVNPS